MKNIAGLLVIVLFVGGCSPSYFVKSADREVSEILEGKKEKVLSDKLPEEGMMLSGETISETIILNLKDSLVMAVKRNPAYQNQKEDVYLQALELTYQKHLYRVRYTVGGEIFWGKNGSENINANLNLNLIKWLANGAELTYDFTKQFVKYLSGSKEKIFQTVMSLDLLQPLLKGAGRKIAQENLVQAERNVIYQMRTFLRYQRNFSVDISEKYFNLLLSKNNLKNYWNNYLFLKQTRKRIEMLSDAGRISTTEVDQAKQNEYNAYQRWLSAYNNTESLLDEFKILLGFSPGLNILLEEKELEQLLEKGISEIKIDPEKFTETALEKRLDLITSYDNMEDAKRAVMIALNNLRTKLDLNIAVTSSSPEKPSPTFELSESDLTAGIGFELPFNKISERNEYRKALIEFERTKREFILKKDEVTLEVIDSFRNLQETYQSYLIQRNSLTLATKRVKSTDLLLQAGRAMTRDLLEAQESYLNARNSLADTVVKYIIYYLDFMKSTELLKIDKKGVWKGAFYEKITGESLQE